MKKKRLFLIVIDPNLALSAEKISDLQNELRATPSIYLYKTKKPKKKGVSLSLSLSNGKVIILLRPKNKKYFLCIGISNRYRLPAIMKYYHEENNAEGLIVESKKIPPCLKHAVDCDAIEQAMESKAEWDPQEGGGHEDKKWKAYIDLYKEIYKDQRFGLPGYEYKNFGKFARIKVNFSELLNDDGIDDGVIDKIKAANGQRISFSLTPHLLGSKTKDTKDVLGTLKSFDEKQSHLDIQLDDFEGVRESVARGTFYAKNPKKSVTSKPTSSEVESNVADNVASEKKATSAPTGSEVDLDVTANATIKFGPVDAKNRTMFFHDEGRETPIFSCLAECTAPNEWLIAPDSIEPQTLMLYADFFSEIDQLDVMDEGLREIKSRQDIWPVLTRERLSKLPREADDIVWTDDCRLNNEQKNTVKNAVGTEELCLIWGPPGTGKTEVIMEIAKQECIRGHKTLIASQANLAVDNALARLHNVDVAWPFRSAKDGYKLEHEDEDKVPLNKTAGVFFAKRLCILIDEQMKENDDDDVVSDLRKNLVTRLNKEIKSKGQLERSMPQMAKLYRNRINVVGATLMRTGKNYRILSETGISEFHTVIVDEVSKALPTELFLPILLGKKVVLVGDHKQLHPMMKAGASDFLDIEEWAERAGMSEDDIDTETTLFELLWEKHDKAKSKVCQKLTEQYRMPEEIQKLIEPFYQDSEGSLICGLTQEKQREMLISHADPWGSGHAFWVETDRDAYEKPEGTSYYNPQEIEVVGDILERLPNKDPYGKDLSVGVITFYGAQLRHLQGLYEDIYSHKFAKGYLTFGTVDRFQGRENDVIICSLVRKNNRREIGFAKKPNRINVAFSRARRALCIVGNRKMFCYEHSDEKAKKTYQKIHDNCHRLFRKNITE